MKHLPKIVIALLLSIFLCIPSALAVLYYTQPMEDASYNLFLVSEDGQEWEDNKVWTVYTDEGGNITELTSDGDGGYLGLDHPGQTFYYSCTLTEELDSPMLQIGAVNQTISIFLGENMIYTDCPELDNRIGYLELPMLEYDRTESIAVSLPVDYLGQVLTIAQSSPTLSEKQTDTGMVWPCRVTLYCGYSYESGLIASAAKTMLPTVLLFALELFLLAAFIWNASVGNFTMKLPVFALAVLFQICSILSQADFFYKYFGTPAVDPSYLCFHLSVGTLLIFLTLYAEKLRPLYLLCTALQWCVSLLYLVTQGGMLLEYGDWYIFFMDLPQSVGFFTLLAALAGAFFLWKQGSRFFRHLAQMALLLLIGYALFLVISIPIFPDYVSHVFTRIAGDITRCLPYFSLQLIWYLCLISSLVSTVIELVEQEAERRSEYAVLSAKNELAMESYENLRRQSEEVMMLRHDSMKHYTLLRTMAAETPERLSAYLEELIGQVENVRPVVASRNQTMNILINGKLNTAAQKGISTEIVRSDAPETLPLTDRELCCLVMNILDNAINAASVSASEAAYIKLDFHCKDNHFVFSCENSLQSSAGKDKKNPSPEHGYGLKIIRQIMSRWGNNMLFIEQSETAYKITAVIPLS